MSTVPISEPHRTIEGRWNLAKSLMLREPSRDNLQLVVMALVGVHIDVILAASNAMAGREVA